MSTEPEKQSKPVAWYRTPIDPKILMGLHQRSDFRGSLQTLGYLGTLALTGGLSFYSTTHWPWWVTVLLVFAHGTCYSFQINAVHELGHGTVFQTKSLNAFFESVFAFLGWINHRMFDVSHARHHQYTLHPPDDLEVVLPLRVMVKHFFQQAIIMPLWPYQWVKEVLRIARGKLQSKWELKLFPEGDTAKRRPAIAWAWTLLIGHGLITLGSVLAGIFIHPRYLMIALLIPLAPMYGKWLFFLCNNTQHIGLQDNVPDFRLCCRTFTLNPIAQFLYWHMNYHTEHHMYAAVPCYKLGKLHRLIKHDLPPCPRGIVATWKDIAAIQKIQEANPSYQHAAPLPGYSNSRATQPA